MSKWDDNLCCLTQAASPPRLAACEAQEKPVRAQPSFFMTGPPLPYAGAEPLRIPYSSKGKRQASSGPLPLPVKRLPQRRPQSGRIPAGISSAATHLYIVLSPCSPSSTICAIYSRRLAYSELRSAGSSSSIRSSGTCSGDSSVSPRSK